MYRRSLLRFLFALLITSFAFPALAQFTRDNAASKKIDEAINEHYLATNFDKAEGVLTGTIKACEDKCSPQVIAKAWMYVGIVRSAGKNDTPGAKEAFMSALAADPNVKLDLQLAPPEVQKIFADLGGASSPATPAPATPAPTPAPAAPAGDDEGGDKGGGGMKCTPTVRLVQTRRPIPIECTTDEEAVGMELRYKPFGPETWKSVKLKKVGEAFRGEVPCDATGTPGPLKVYVRAKDAQGESVDSFGSKAKPVEFQVSESAPGEPPTYPGEPAPARCQAKGECPPDFPGCSDKAKRGGKDWGAACDNSVECKEGLLCQEGVCETAPSCDTNADCQTGACVGGKCDIPAGEGAPPSPYKKNWFGFHVAQDFAFIGGSNVCDPDVQATDNFACYAAGSRTDPYNGVPYPGSSISTGSVVATTRLLLSYDRAFSPNVMLGARVGFAFRGGPAYGKTQDSAGTAFLPVHAEARLSYWFGRGALSRIGFRPYVHAGGGLAQVDAKVKVPVLDCSENPNIMSTVDKNNCVTAGDTKFDDEGRYPRTDYDAWKKLGQTFVTVGGGVVYAFKDNMGLQLNINLMYMLPASGVVIEPSLGYVFGL